jgi:hypothetical protein
MAEESARRQREKPEPERAWRRPHGSRLKTMLLVGVLLAALGNPPVSGALARHVHDLLRPGVGQEHKPPADPPSGRPDRPRHT